MSQAICFNEVTFTPVNHDNQIWIRSVELARALGYKDESSIRRLYDRNADEFSPDMTQVVEIPETVNLTGLGNLTTKTRLFSPRGCHLIAMFARTAVAKAFRKWVLDVLDKLTVRAALPAAKSKKPAQKALPTAKQKALPAARLTIEEDIQLFAEEVKQAHAQVYVFQEQASEKLVARTVEIMDRLTSRASDKLGPMYIGKICAVATEILPHVVAKTREALRSPYEYLSPYDDPAKLLTSCVKLESRL